MSNSIRNTKNDAPELHLIGAMQDQADGRPQGSFIEDMEAEGQRQLCSQSERLPEDGFVQSRETWEKLGFEYVGPVEGDALFVEVKFPEGWKLEKTNHSMWSKLLDAQGRTRANVFYKAAFYDRKAHVSLCRRYSYDLDYGDAGRSTRPWPDGVEKWSGYDCDEGYSAAVWDMSTAHDRDDATKLFTSTEIAWRSDAGYFDKLNALASEARAWLNANFPNWEDPAAYWD